MAKEQDVKTALKLFHDPCRVFAHVVRLEAGEHQAEVGRREVTIRVVRERLSRAVVDVIRYMGTLVRDDIRCLVYRIRAWHTVALMAYNVLGNVAVIAVREKSAVTFYE